MDEMVNPCGNISRGNSTLYAIHRAIVLSALITVFLTAALFISGKALYLGEVVLTLTLPDLIAVCISQLLLVLNFRSWTALVEMLHLSTLQSEPQESPPSNNEQLRNQKNKSALIFIILKMLSLLLATAFFLFRPRRELLFFIFGFLVSLLLGSCLGFRQYFNSLKEAH